MSEAVLKPQLPLQTGCCHFDSRGTDFSSPAGAPHPILHSPTSSSLSSLDSLPQTMIRRSASRCQTGRSTDHSRTISSTVFLATTALFKLPFLDGAGQYRVLTLRGNAYVAADNYLERRIAASELLLVLTCCLT